MAGLAEHKKKHSVCFINFVNYITIDCLLARLGRDFYCRTDYVFFSGIKGISSHRLCIPVGN
ncbi:hypothetical protein FA039_28455 [Escherichia coli]|nr:hypothetical protein [Escherichia coli]